MNIKASMPRIEPMNEYRMPTPNARPASPFSAIGPPSKTVEIEDGVPGILRRIAEIKPPEIPPMYKPTRRAIPLVASRLNVIGRKRTTAIVALRPGTDPKIIPIIVPAQIRNRHIGFNTLANASVIIIT